MIDYRALEALYMVQSVQSFELAAKKLFITQSAVSQRIKSLEDHYGELVLIRTIPYRFTPLGQQLIGHYKKISMLEGELEEQLGLIKTNSTLAIALNRDSLDTWFVEMIEEEKEFFQNVPLEIIADDESLTLNYLKNGTVSACVSSSEKEILGGKVSFLGTIPYALVASPAFLEKYSLRESPKKGLKAAPVLRFDNVDDLQNNYLHKYFGIAPSDLKYLSVPSVKSFVKFAELGYGYGMVAKRFIKEELAKKSLVEIFPEKGWEVPLYWHHLSVESKFYQKFNAEIIRSAKSRLKNM